MRDASSSAPTCGALPRRAVSRCSSTAHRTTATSPGRAIDHRARAERGYAVVVQDVRADTVEGEFEPYRNEGRDGYDTIEWAAAQDWSDGSVGTFGLSYPGAVQWLAALESPPHLKAMVPAMTFSTPRNFFYSGGVFDMSWTAWIWNNIAPDVRVRRGLDVPRTGEEAARPVETDPRADPAPLPRRGARRVPRRVSLLVRLAPTPLRVTPGGTLPRSGALRPRGRGGAQPVGLA